MIHSRDLMIGNYIKIDKGISHIVSISTGLFQDYWDDNVENVVVCNNNSYYHCSELELESITLTEDILLKCGFKADIHKNYWRSLDLERHIYLIPSEDYYYPQIVQQPEMSMQDEEVVSLNRISSLHELQNLFKILTGNDLKVGYENKCKRNE